ncbi:PKD domain-containing protein [Methanocalculus taiwanensis]|uniref:PKD domain-containing protein n=1 Tax=Methanocalculus taiwanensis TaxID=106207 RepID=A0ABD4TIU8_9EURY|nr:PKD domain-containing protein [Methanocalculus taiwanensis]
MERVKRSDQDAVSPAISVMLLVLLAALIAIIIYAFMYGIPGGLEKSAFIAAEAGVVEINGTEYVTIQHRGGDDVFLNGSGAARGIPIDIRATAAGGGPVLAGADAPVTWTPGEILYLINTQEGHKITKDKTAAGAGTGFPAGPLELVIIDTQAEVRIFGSILTISGEEPGPDDPPIRADFNATQANPLSTTVYFTGWPVHLTANTTNATSWSWDFGDGSMSSAQDPTHTFNRGVYTITLNASNNAHAEIITKEIRVIPRPIGWWLLDGNAEDVSGHGNHGTILRDPNPSPNPPYGSGTHDNVITGTWVPGKRGLALSFDARTYIRVPHSPVLDLSPGGTIFLWTNPSHVGNYYFIIGKGANDQPDNYEWIISSGGRILFEYHDTFGDSRSATSASDLIVQNTWQSIATVADGTTVAFYRNGALFDTRPMIGSLKPNSETLFVGKQQMFWNGRYYPFYYRGLLNDVMIFQETLTSAEIQELNSAFPA